MANYYSIDSQSPLFVGSFILDKKDNLGNTPNMAN